MKNILRLKLFGYTVQGIDRRNGTDFEDHIVVWNLDVKFPRENLDYIMHLYNRQGFQVDKIDIIPDRKLDYNPDKGITVHLDLQQLYLDQLKVVKEQQNDSNSGEWLCQRL